MEEKGSLELVYLYKEASQGGESSDGQCDVFDFGLGYLHSVLHDVEVGIGHNFHKLIAHVFNFDFEAGAQTSVPLLLHGWLHDIIELFRVNLKVQVEGRFVVEWLLF